MPTDSLDNRAPTANPSGTAAGWIRVWDLPTRAFHWLLVFCLTITFKTGFFGPASALDWHVWAGYAIGALVVWRLIWGLFGSEYSRLDRLFGALANLREHAEGLLGSRPKHYAGHNPLGSLMILGLLGVLIAITGTGFVVLGGVDKQGVLASSTPYAVGHLAKGVHQLLAYLLVAMIIGHVGGVIAESVLLRLPLIRGMITGWLPAGGEGEVARPRSARLAVALGCAAFAMFAVYDIVASLIVLPALGLPGPITNAGYLKECGACHWAVHPSLLPRTSWERMMGSLTSHFGENADLDAKTTAEIAAFLSANAAETADTQAANRFRAVDAAYPLRITATGFWVQKHREIAEAVFKSTAVGGRMNCPACHRDAKSGRFNVQAIDVPATTLEPKP